MAGLSKRLDAVASLVRPGSVIADIGTDHGYIPVFLSKASVIKGAVASDIHEGPLSSCKALIEQEGLQDRIQVRLSDGLDRLKPEEYDTVIIAGMGGELIARILSRCGCLRDKHIILNPMTHPEFARKFLFDNGYGIKNDFIVRDGRHYYSVFDAEYDGSQTVRDRADYYLGNIRDFSDKEYFIHLLHYLKSKSKSGEDYSDVIRAVEEKL